MIAAETASSDLVPRYKPTQAELVMLKSYTDNNKSRPPVGAVKVTQTGERSIEINSSHQEPTIGSIAIMNTFGTTDFNLANKLLNQIVNITLEPQDNGIANEANVNAALAAVHGIAPQDEAEAMLATQMVGVHFLVMQLLRRASQADTPQKLDSLTNNVTKALRTFTSQVEALKRYRSKGESRVVVQHQHVNVSADKANIQVNGTAAKGVEGGGINKNLEGQGHALGYAPGASVWSENPVGDAVPITSGKG